MPRLYSYCKHCGCVLGPRGDESPVHVCDERMVEYYNEVKADIEANIPATKD